ncbi:MAG: DUF4919 domain-containing protein [Niabella sp.]
MNRLILIIITHIICTETYSQTLPDSATLKKVVEDSISPYGYTGLLKKFNDSPEFLYPSEGRILYYGQVFAPAYRAFSSLFLNSAFNELANKRNFEAAIQEGEKILLTNPASLKVLLVLLNCYAELKKESDAKLTKTKLDLLLASILAVGKGDSDSTTLKVVSVEDEYAIMAMLGIKGKSRRSIAGKTGSFVDRWSIKYNKENRDFFVEVLYAF